VDFDHQFLEAEKYDSKRTYKGFDGYSPGVCTFSAISLAFSNKNSNFALNRTRHRFSSARNAAYQGGTFFCLCVYEIYQTIAVSPAANRRS